MTDYMNVRLALADLLDGTMHAGRTVATLLRLTTDYATEATKPGRAVALVYTTGGREGQIDRVDYVTLQVYGPPLAAEDVAESMRSFLCGDPAIDGPDGKAHDIPGHGYVDGIRCEVTPHDVPHPSDTVARADFTVHVTHRPL